ncbi:hypothetical protein FRC10_002896, partial [Ceratobasidium sp. 414]
NNLLFHYYQPIRAVYGPSMDEKILNDHDQSFRNRCTSELQHGRSQGRSDDLVCLKSVLPEHNLFCHLPANNARGFSTDEYANVLCTHGLDIDNLETRAALNRGIVDAPSNQLFAGLFTGYHLPLQICIHWKAFAAVNFLSIPTSPSFMGRVLIDTLPPALEDTVPSIAYVAMLLRFVLHNPGDWYTAESDLNTRYNYYIFYTMLLGILEDQAFTVLIFPRHHLRLANAPNQDGQSSHERALAYTRALEADRR